MRNPTYNSFGTIDCEIEIRPGEWVPFTASPDDVEAHGRAIFADALKAEPAPYVAPDPAIALDRKRKVMVLSFSQLLIGLVAMAWITEAEGEAWLSGSALPAEVLAMIDGLPADMQFPAKARALRMTNAVRMDPLVLELAEGRNISPEDMDTFFTAFAEV